MKRGSRRPRRCRIAVVLFAIALGTWLGWRSVRHLAGIPTLESSDASGHRIVDRDGRLLWHAPSERGTRGRPTSLEDLGPRIVHATIVAEDRRFYDHDGVDEAAIARASGQALLHGRVVSGASTITQQLVKMTSTGGEPGARTMGDKLFEMGRAANLEESTTKTEILENYFTRLFYGRGVVGPEEAARFWFGVRARDLSWAQAALLAVLPRAPTLLDPLVHPDRAAWRQRALLRALHDRGHLSEEELTHALAEPIDVRIHRGRRETPHFVDMLVREHRLVSGDLTVTTIDAVLQSDVQALAREHLSKLSERGARHAAVVVVDNDTGDVLAYVGNADPEEPHAGQVDMASARRQPGSSLKPFVYALGYESKQIDLRPLADVPTTFASATGVYVPSNFDGGFAGPVAPRDALATSLNIPALKVASALGPSRLERGLSSFGLTSIGEAPQDHGATLALGSAEVSLREVARAYVTLARGGERIDLRYTSTQAPTDPVRVVSAEAAALVGDALSDPLARLGGPMVPRGHGLPFPIALKTGTSSGYRDAWTIGFTRERTVAVWIGNADGTPMRDVTGASGAGPLFTSVMERAMRNVDEPDPLFTDAVLEERDVCPLSGLRPGPDCPHQVRRRVARSASAERCSTHLRARRRGDAWVCDAQGEVVARMPSAYEDWLEHGVAPQTDAHGARFVPASRVTGCEPGLAKESTVAIVEPRADTTFLLDPHGPLKKARVRAKARVSPSSAETEVEFVVDGRVAARVGAPFVAHLDLPRGHHDIHVRRRGGAAASAEALRVTVR